MKIGESDIIEN